MYDASRASLPPIADSRDKTRIFTVFPLDSGLIRRAMPMEEEEEDTEESPPVILGFVAEEVDDRERKIALSRHAFPR